MPERIKKGWHYAHHCLEEQVRVRDEALLWLQNRSHLGPLTVLMASDVTYDEGTKHGFGLVIEQEVPGA